MSTDVSAFLLRRKGLETEWTEISTTWVPGANALLLPVDLALQSGDQMRIVVVEYDAVPT